MKKIMMTMVALLTMTAAMAQQSDNKQQRPPKKPDVQQMTERMAKELNLDDAQKAKVLALNKEYEDVIGGPGMRGGHHGGPRGPRPDGETGASPKAQNDKAQAKDGEQKTDKRPQRPELTEEQKAEMKQRMAKRQEYDKKLKEILTEEQQQKMQKMHHRGGHRPAPGK